MKMTSITSPTVLGQVLKAYRRDKKLTQSQVGERLNLSQKTVSNIESGVPGVRLETLFRLLTALGLEFNLVERDTSMATEEIWS